MQGVIPQKAKQSIPCFLSAEHVCLQPAEVVFYSADGKKMMESRVEAGNSSLSLQTLPQGVYFVSIRNASGATVQKIVKQ